MDIGATNAKAGLSKLWAGNCFNCDEFGHFAWDCKKPKRPCHQYVRAAIDEQPQEEKEANEQQKAMEGMSFDEMKAFFADLKDN